MADQNEGTSNQQAPVGNAAPSASGQPANPAPTGDDIASFKAELDRLRKHADALTADNAKYRQRDSEEIKKAQADKAAAEAKLKEQGDHLKLYEIEKDKRAALEAQLADLTPKASQWEAVAKTMSEKIEAAKASSDLPASIKKAIASAGNPAAALDILDEFRAEQARAAPGKQPAPPAPAQGAAPASPKVSKTLDQMTPQEIHNLTPAERAEHFKGTASNQTAIKWF